VINRGPSGPSESLWTNIKNHIPKGTFSAAGTALGTGIGARFGNPLAGGTLGGLVGQTVAKIVGFGDYHLKDQRLKHNSFLRPQRPSFQSSGNGIRITHREYVCDIVTHETLKQFDKTEFWVNPGNTSLFPWLSGVAANFELYKFHGLMFEFRSSSSVVSTTTPALGVVVMASQYDVAESSFSSKSQMESTDFAATGRPCDQILHGVECNPRDWIVNNFRVRIDDSEDVDPTTYDTCNFTIAACGCTGTYTIGELWVTYDVQLHKPWQPLSSRAAVSAFDIDAQRPVPTGDEIQIFTTSKRASGLNNKDVEVVHTTAHPEGVLEFRRTGKWLCSIQCVLKTWDHNAAIGLTHRATFHKVDPEHFATWNFIPTLVAGSETRDYGEFEEDDGGGRFSIDISVHVTSAPAQVYFTDLAVSTERVWCYGLLDCNYYGDLPDVAIKAKMQTEDLQDRLARLEERFSHVGDEESESEFVQTTKIRDDCASTSSKRSKN